MGNGTNLSKSKAAELKELAANLELSPTGKENKAELISIIDDAVAKKLKSLKVTELRALASDYDINLEGAKKKADIIDVVHGNLTVEHVRVLFDVSTEKAGAAPVEDVPDRVESLEEIGEELADVEHDLEDTIHKMEQEAAPDMADIYEIDQKLADVVKQDMDFSNVASMLDMGRIKYLDRKYAESMSMLMEATKVCQQFYEDYNDVTQAFVILSAEKLLEECREAGSNDENAADALIHAKRSFLRAGKTRDEAVKALADTANKVYREQVIYLEERMAFIEPLINALRVQGVDIFNAERYLHRAREAFLAGELSSVNEHLDRSQNTAEESKEIWINDIANDMPRVELIIQQARDLGAEVSNAEKHMEQAQVAFENEDYSLCSELKKMAERKAMESQRSQIQKAAQLEREKLGDADKILAKLVPLVREADAYGINTQEINAAMSNARNALVNNDYVNALTYARDAEMHSKNLWSQIKSQREAILSSGQPLKHCQTCNELGITILGNGKAVCANCGMVYDVQVRNAQPPGGKKKKGWFK